MRTLTICLLVFAGIAHAESGTVEGKVTLMSQGVFGKSTKGDASSVAIVLEGGKLAAGKKPQANKAMRQHERAFVPGMIVIEKGGTIDFPNDDKVDHNVFSPSETARFDLELYRSGTSKAWTFNRVGAVNVFCNIHEEMAARIVVVDTPWYTTTDKDGRFAIRDIAPGSYNVVAWPKFGDPYRATITVKAGKNDLDLTVVEGKRPDHQRKDGTPYGRYQ